DRRAPAGRASHHPRWGNGLVQGRQGAACVDVTWDHTVSVGLGASALRHVTCPRYAAPHAGDKSMSGHSAMNRSPYHLVFSTLRRGPSQDDLPVRRTVPPWTGSLVRTAPATFEVGERRYQHGFDGLAMLRKFAFASGRVAYANRYLRSQSYREAM